MLGDTGEGTAEDNRVLWIISFKAAATYYARKLGQSQTSKGKVMNLL